MKKFLGLLCFVVFVLPGFAQLNRADYTPRAVETFAFTQKNLQEGPMIVDSVASILDAINSLFGPGVSVSNLSYTGPSFSIGSFMDTTTVYASAGDFGIDQGILLTTGSIYDAPGPNDNSSTSTYLGLPGDADLNALIPGYFTYDAAVIEFDFTPMTDTLIACNFIFASEEYLEWVNSSFNDVFGFFISGPGFMGLQNLATIQNIDSLGNVTEVPISVNSINDLTNSSYFVYNQGDMTEYDGFTTPIQLTHTITPGQPYHFKIAVADAGDGILDAAVFLEAGSFLSYASVPVTNFTFAVNGMQVAFTNTTNYATSYLWNFGDGQVSTDVSPTHAYDQPGTYVVELEARNYYQVSTVTQTIIIQDINEFGSPGADDFASLVTRGPGLFEIRFAGLTNLPARISLYSATGQLVSAKSNTLTKENFPIDLSPLSKGIYFLQVSSGNRSARFKLLNP